MTPFKPKYTTTNLVSLGLVPVLMTGLMAWATATPGNEAWHLSLGWLVVLLTWGIVAAYFVAARNALSRFKWVTRQGLVVGSYNCDPNLDGIEEVIDEAIGKLKDYPNAASVLANVKIVFMPGAFYSHGRKVAGIQMNDVVAVAAAETVRQTALAHELGHVVLQYLGGDPTEEEAHKILAALGL